MADAKLPRRPVKVTHKRTPQPAQVAWALRTLDRLPDGLLDALSVASKDFVGRPGTFTTKHVLIAWLLLVTENGHQAEYTDAIAQLIAMTPEQRAAIGLEKINPKTAYDAFYAKTRRVMDALELGVAYASPDGDTDLVMNLDAWADTLIDASIPDDLPSSKARSVDGTHWETSARFRRGVAVDGDSYDGEAPLDASDYDDAKQQKASRAAVAKATAKGFSIGADGRAVYTTDVDARAGHRTPTPTNPDSRYIGYELHLAVQVSDFTYQGDVSRVINGLETPKFVTSARLTPAGTHRGKAVVPALLWERACRSINLVVWDRGYSTMRFRDAHALLYQAGIQPVFDLTSKQRKVDRTTIPGTIVIDGTVFSEHLPREFHNLPTPPMGSSADVRAEYEDAFNARARWAYVRHSGPDANGRSRFMCPFHAGKLRARTIRQAKAAKNAVLVELPEDVTECCSKKSGIITAPAEALNLTQAYGIPYGTTAHAQAYGRRNMVETANSYLRGGYASLNRAYSRLRGLKNRRFVLGFLLAGLNRVVEESWRERLSREAEAEANAEPKPRAKRGSLTLGEVIEGAQPRTKKASRTTFGAASATQPGNGDPGPDVEVA